MPEVKRQFMEWNHMSLPCGKKFKTADLIISNLMEGSYSHPSHIALAHQKQYASSGSYALVLIAVEQTTNRLLCPCCCIIALRVPSLLLSCSDNSLYVTCCSLQIIPSEYCTLSVSRPNWAAAMWFII